MATYKKEKGFAVQTLSTDTIASQIAGGSWSSGGNLPGARDECAGGGTLTAGIQFGGYSPPESAYKTETFEYDGTAWTEGGDMSSGRSNFGGAGTQTAALAIGGQSPGVPAGLTATEEYNGSSWTAGGALPTGTNSNYGCTGTQTATLQIGGSSPSRVATTLSYNGSSWSDTSNDLPVTIDRNGASGTTTAAITGGGREGSPGGYTNKFFTYNGSSWTAITTYPISASMISVQGPYTDVIAANGLVPPGSTNSNWWDGTSWTAAPSTSNYHGQCAHANSTAGATSGNGFIAGSDPSGYNGTEHWNSAPSIFTKTNLGQVYFNSTANAFKVTAQPLSGGTWASTPNINSPRGSFQTTGAGTTSEGIIFGGLQPSLTGKTERWNGSSWTEVADLNDPTRDGGGSGNYTSAISAGGDPGGVTDNAETWNGSAWTQITEMGQAREGLGMAGTGSAAIAFAGGPTTDSQLWNGSAWTEIADVNNPRKFGAGVGTSTSAVYFGGQDPSQTNKTETYNGSTWTETADLNTARASLGGSGTSNSVALAFGGFAPAPTKKNETESWDGTSWTELNNLGTARNGGGAAGNSGSSAIYAGGDIATGYTAASEEFTVATANSTITLG